jgi:hypothetical protein
MTADNHALADRLYADALAADLRAPDKFTGACTDTCWDAIEAYVRERADVYQGELSLTSVAAERALQMAHERWHRLAISHRTLRITRLLVGAGRKLLQPDGREMILRVDRVEPGSEILRWRFVSLALPPGILIAAATPRGSPPPAAVRLLHASIAPDTPVALNHVHRAAMLSFEELWTSLRLRALLRPAELRSSLIDGRAFCPGLHQDRCLGGRSRGDKSLAKKRPVERARHMAEWGDLLRQAFIARRVLDRHAHHSVSLSTCSDHVCNEGRRVLRSFLVGRTKTYRAIPTRYPWPDELIGLERRYRKATTEAFLHGSDAYLRKLVSDQAAEERGLLGHAFAYLRPDDNDAHDPLYETLFVQYLRVETAVFGLLVHPPGERGLEKFLEHFLQIKVYAPETAFLPPQQPHEPGLRVEAAEYRVAPDMALKILERQDREVETGAAPKQPGFETAWLVHFKRDKPDKGLPLYSATIRQMESEADQLVRALTAKPTRLRTLRGIDLCGVEELQPLWVSAQTLRRMRDRSSEIAGRRPGLRLQPLRMTVHAGEDFGWLTSGVRAVAEPFHWNLVERGDRIGHGIAITLNPEKWWVQKENVSFEVKQFDRLLDLAFLAEYADKLSIDQEEWLRAQIIVTVQQLRLEPELNTARAGEINVVETAKDLWRALGSRTTRRLMQMRVWRGNDDQLRHEKWIHQYLWNRSTQALAAKVLVMKVNDDYSVGNVAGAGIERALLVKARSRLIREVARWQVCLETNPSSNMIVSGLDAMGAAQDFLQRRPTRNKRGKLETLTWTISTDDPITFSTTLADEYAYAWAGMVLREGRPYDPAYARALLDEAAATSMRTRFTIPREDQARTGKDPGKRRGNARSA